MAKKTAKNKPVDTLRDGSISATIWKNDTKDGHFYSVNFSRVYTDDKEKAQNSDSFSGTQLLKISVLAEKAYAFIAELREAEAA